MSKYIIDTGDYLFTTDGVLVAGFDCDNKPATFYNSLDNLEELNSDYINEHFSSLQDEAYLRGLEEAWEAARKIMCDDGIDMNTLCTIFRRGCSDSIIRDYSASEAIAKLKAYEDGKHSDRIEVGDEVIWSDGSTIIVTMVYVDGGSEWCDGVNQNGRAYHVLLENVRKTGKHYDIQSILEAMRK